MAFFSIGDDNAFAYTSVAVSFPAAYYPVGNFYFWCCGKVMMIFGNWGRAWLCARGYVIWGWIAPPPFSLGKDGDLCMGLVLNMYRSLMIW